MGKGSLSIVGTGIKLGAHITAEAQGYLKAADIVFAATPAPGFIGWLQDMSREVVNLGEYYQVERPREEIYAAMSDAILQPVRAGRRVCAAFYGHPGVFVLPAHRAIAKARHEGFDARMLPGISAEDCLFADLGIDPGRLGCQSYEASDFLLHERRFEPTAPLILWQIGVVGERGICKGPIEPAYLESLIELLCESYPPSHEVIIYAAALTAIHEPRMERVRLESLPRAKLDELATLYIPPYGFARPNVALRAKLGLSSG